jgi:hypothetical protein
MDITKLIEENENLKTEIIELNIIVLSHFSFRSV